MILNEKQIKDYLIQQITFWTAEIKNDEENCFTADIRDLEAFQFAYEDVYEKLFGVEEFKKVYQEIYDGVYNKE